MDSLDVVDLLRQAILEMMILSAPVLLVGMVVGLLIGLVQALTQIQEQSLSFVPKLLAMLVTLGFCLPWLLGRMVDYSQELFLAIPGNL